MELSSCIADLRDRPDLDASGYNERLDLGWKVAERQIRACNRLAQVKRLTALQRSMLREALVAALPGSPVAGCVPECCSASMVRHRQFTAKLAALTQLCRLGADDGATLSRSLVDWLLQPPGRLLALPTARLLAGSPAAAAYHLASLERAASHPHPRVVEEVAQALRATGHPRARRPLVDLLRDPRPPVALAAVRGLRDFGEDALSRAALAHALRHHPDDGVKYTALKILLTWGHKVDARDRRWLERHASAAHPGLRHAVARALA